MIDKAFIMASSLPDPFKWDGSPSKVIFIAVNIWVLYRKIYVREVCNGKFYLHLGRQPASITHIWIDYILNAYRESPWIIYSQDSMYMIY